MFNQVMLIGNVGRDVEFKEKFVTFSLATSRRWQDKQTEEWKTETEWHRCVVFGLKMNICKRMLKGDLITVQGSIRTSTYDKNGEKRSSISIIVDHILILTKRTREETQTLEEAKKPETVDADIFGPSDDDIPF